jgi:hypothetical protein
LATGYVGLGWFGYEFGYQPLPAPIVWLRWAAGQPLGIGVQNGAKNGYTHPFLLQYALSATVVSAVGSSNSEDGVGLCADVGLCVLGVMEVE